MTEYFGFIYEWTDSTNGKTYVGSRKGPTDGGYIGSGKLFKRAYEKRSKAFARKILEYVFEDSKKILLEKEQKYLDLIDWSNIYNLSRIAGGGNTRTNFTEKEFAKYCQKLSDSHKGEKHHFYGIPCSEERKQKISEKLKGQYTGRIPWNKGIPCSEEYKRKNSESSKGEQHHFYGIPITEERRKNISESKKGKPWSAARRAAYERRWAKDD